MAPTHTSERHTHGADQQPRERKRELRIRQATRRALLHGSGPIELMERGTDLQNLDHRHEATARGERRQICP